MTEIPDLIIFEKPMDTKGANANFVYVYCKKCKRFHTFYKEHSSDRNMIDVCPECDVFIKIIIKVK